MFTASSSHRLVELIIGMMIKVSSRRKVGSCIAAYTKFAAFSSHRLVERINHLTRHDDCSFVMAQWDKQGPMGKVGTCIVAYEMFTAPSWYGADSQLWCYLHCKHGTQCFLQQSKELYIDSSDSTWHCLTRPACVNSEQAALKPLKGISLCWRPHLCPTPPGRPF